MIISIDAEKAFDKIQHLFNHLASFCRARVRGKWVGVGLTAGRDLSKI